MGTAAVICCTGKEKENRPNKDHLDELEKCFDMVYVTENLPVNKNSIRKLFENKIRTIETGRKTE